MQIISPEKLDDLNVAFLSSQDMEDFDDIIKSYL
jgi:hypothetical protein